MDYKEKYEQGLECLEEILNSGQEKIKMTLLKERLLPFFPELESENEKMRRKCINFLNLHKRFHSSSAEIDDCIAWLKKQKATDKEIIFRALPGTDIIAAAKQALEKIEIGKEVILSFNDIYIPVNGKTVAEICNEYFAWHEKQGENKSKDETKNAQETSDNQYVEYVYILDYCSGRVIVAKHDVEESISELFEQLGLKESQCHYMVSSYIFSIEYINF